MSKSVEQKSLDTGALLNTKKVHVVVTRNDGSQFAIESHKKVSGIRLSDFKELPAGIEFVAE